MTTPTRVNDDGECEKQCGRCGEWWPLDILFFRRIRGKLVSPCRACSALWSVTPSVKPKRWTADKIHRMYDDYTSGMTLKQVGEAHGLRGTEVRSLFVKNGLARRKRTGGYNRKEDVCETNGQHVSAR